MLAGLLFATSEADDRPGALTATLPFGGLTLVEHQARLLVEAGATQLVVVVGRLTPELAGALARVARRGVTVDSVRTAEEAAAKLHPLAWVLVLADGLVAAPTAVELLAEEGPDALLTHAATDCPVGFERIGGGACWAGVARVSAARLGEVAALPADYDLQSSLVRSVAQRASVQVPIAPEDIAAGHAVERTATALDERGRAMMAGVLAAHRNWFDRYVVAPAARPILAAMMRHATPTVALAGAVGVLGVVGLSSIALGSLTFGLLATTLATMGAIAGTTLAWLRDEGALLRPLRIGAVALPGLAVLLLGRAADAADADVVRQVVALSAVVAAGLAERAARGRTRRRWWGTPAAYLAVATAATIAGAPAAGLALAAIYAAVTLGAAIEALRSA